MPGTGGQPGRTRWVWTGPVSYKGLPALQQDIATLKSALAGQRHEEAFMPAVSPSNLANWNRNEHYKSEEEYLYALADALREEYRAIIEAGVGRPVAHPPPASHDAKQPAAQLTTDPDWAPRRGTAPTPDPPRPAPHP